MIAENKSLKFDCNQILNRYWELANLEPEKTKGNISGQLEALDALCQLLRSAPAEKPKAAAKPLPEVEIYRSGWMN
jgi:hypothetical protein